MKQQEQLKAMEQYAKECSSADTTGHDWSYIERVVTDKDDYKAEGADLFICEVQRYLRCYRRQKFKDPVVALKGVERISNFN